MKITSNLEEYEKDLQESARMFYPKNSNIEENVTIFHTFEKDEENNLKNTFTVTDHNGTYSHTHISNKEKQSEISVRKLLQIGLYETLKTHTKKQMPWGSLVGIRPVKMVVDLLRRGHNRLSALRHLKEDYYVSQNKCEIINEILDTQGHRMQNDNLINLYIHIPFCVSKCSYCSFMSSLTSKSGHLISPYVEALIEEIKHAKELIAKKHYIVKTIYVGGGTPTALPVEALERVLNELKGYAVNEFTVEAGRVDTITKEMLDMLKRVGVTRISINPKTLVIKY